MHPIKHFCTITRHRHQVIRHCFKAGIGWQGLFHDLSKYAPCEFLAGAKHYQGTRSPNEVERELLGYSPAWLHHKGRNRHHFEYWNDYNPQTKQVGPVEMPLRYVVEMLCDRLAASKIYQGENYTEAHPLDYFMRGKPRRIIHPATSDLLEEWLTMVRDEGEAAAFAHVRRLLKEQKKSCHGG